MRTFLAIAATGLALLAAACGSSGTSSESSSAAGGGGSSAANACAKDSLQTLQPGKLTISTDNPAYTPYFAGGPGHDWKGEFNNDPYADKGFEDAVAYAVADRLGFTADEVTWAATPFNQSFKPGPKNFDYYLAQVSITPQRQQSVDLSDPYYAATQAVVALKGKPITKATSLADLKSYKLGVEIGTTSADAISSVIAPDTEPNVYNRTRDATQALDNGQIDGLVVDFPTAYYIAFVDPGGGTVVGQFSGTGGEDQWALVLDKDSPLTPCVNQAIASLKSDGTLAAIEKKWLSDIVGAPVLH
jgi:polar amino acid transport system substrate-binding protein